MKYLAILGLAFATCACGTQQTDPVTMFSIDLMDAIVLVDILEDGRCSVLSFGTNSGQLGENSGWSCKIEKGGSK